MGRGPGVRAASRTSIQIDFVYRGIRCRERIALPPTEANKKYVKRLKAAIEHEIATKTFDYAKHFPTSPRARRFAGGAGTSLKSAIDSYLASIATEIEPETLEEYQHDAAICVAGLGNDPIGDYTRARIRVWVSGLGLSRKRINNLLIPLRGMFKQALEDETISSSPLEGFKVRKVSKPKQDTIDPFTPAEVGRLAKAEQGTLWEFWAWSGLRSGEIIGLECGDVASDCSRITVRRAVRVGRVKVPKTEAGARVVHLLEPARRAIAALVKGRVGPVFRNPNTGERFHEDRNLARAFRKACQQANVRYRYPYQLRHTFATWALSSGENPAWAAKEMGHKDLVMFFKVYAKWMQSLDPSAGSRMTKAAKSKAA